MSKFPKPWRTLWAGDAFRVVDANDRHLFVITGDEFPNGEEGLNADGTVLIWGEDEDNKALGIEIQRMVEEFSDERAKDRADV